MFKIIRSSENGDGTRQSRDSKSDAHTKCVDGRFSGKSATAGPNPPIRRSPK